MTNKLFLTLFSHSFSTTDQERPHRDIQQDKIWPPLLQLLPMFSAPLPTHTHTHTHSVSVSLCLSVHMESFAAKRLIINKEAKLARFLLLRVLLLLQHPDLDYRNHNILLWSKNLPKAANLACTLSLSLSVSPRVVPSLESLEFRLFSRLVSSRLIVSLERASPKTTQKQSTKTTTILFLQVFLQMEQTNKQTNK